MVTTDNQSPMLSPPELLCDAIIRDDTEMVMAILAATDTDNLWKLLEGNIISDECMKILKGRHKEDILRLCPGNAWSLAVSSCALGVMKVFVSEYNVDVHQVDIRGDNAIHVMIRAAHVLPEMEARSVQAYSILCNLLPLEGTRKLLKAENEDGLQPLELAMLLGTFQIFSAIFSTKGKDSLSNLNVCNATFKLPDHINARNTMKCKTIHGIFDIP